MPLELGVSVLDRTRHQAGVRISMDGRGRALDNIFIERVWRSLKYEEVYLHDYETVQEAKTGIRKYFDYYNNERQHQSLDYRTPGEVYYKGIVEQLNQPKTGRPTELDQT